MIFSQLLKIKFLQPQDPNRSIGKLIVFKKDGVDVAHLSLTWNANLWFGYLFENNYQNIYFPCKFNDFQNKNGENLFGLVLNDNCLFIIQDNFVSKFSLNCVIYFNQIEYIENFDNINVEKIEDNKYEVLDIIYNDNKNLISTDIILTVYKSFDCLKSFIKSLLNTIDNNILTVKKFILCDNNVDTVEIERLKLFFDYLQNNFNDIEWIYLKNEDETYVHSRISGLNKSLKLCNSDVVSIFDSDTLFIDSSWCKTYQFYNQFSNATGCGIIPEQIYSDYYRDSYIILRRFHPFFFHAKREYLQKKVKEDENYFGDMKLQVEYKNMVMNFMGLHFAKVYSEAKCNQDNMFMILNDNDYLQFSYINSISSEKYKNIFVIHLEGMSFEETWKSNNYVLKRYKNIFDNIINFIRFRKSSCNLSDILFIAAKISEMKLKSIFEKDIINLFDFSGNIIYIFNDNDIYSLIKNKNKLYFKKNDNILENILFQQNEKSVVEVINIDNKISILTVCDNIFIIQDNINTISRIFVNKNLLGV